MKTCPSCKRSLTIDNFSKCADRYDGVQSYCKKCSVEKRMAYYYAHHQQERDAHKNRKKKIKNQWINFLENSRCIDCGEKRYYVLELDHINGDKDECVSLMVAKGRSWKRIEEEIKKCEVRCANCHRARHHLERQSFLSSVVE